MIASVSLFTKQPVVEQTVFPCLIDWLWRENDLFRSDVPRMMDKQLDIRDDSGRIRIMIRGFVISSSRTLTVRTVTRCLMTGNMCHGIYAENTYGSSYLPNGICLERNTDIKRLRRSVK